ncbi:MAG: Ig-like domain-containing protein [Gemmatimonas sp.]
MMKRSTRLAGLSLIVGVVGYACANPNQPPGGPPDAEAPKLVKVTPANGTVGARTKVVSFQFDEVVSETPKGFPNLPALVFISPRSGVTEVEWHRSRIDVKPKAGWRPNTVYSVLLGAGLQDLRQNAIDTATRVVFSTGGDIPATKLEGVVFDWPAGKFAPKAIVEAISKDYWAITYRNDTTGKPFKDSVVYQTIADSLGRYSLEFFPAGNYILRAIVDANNNRLPDVGERYDTVSVTIGSTYTQELYAFGHDSSGLIMRPPVAQDSNRTLKVTFDKPVHPTQNFQNTQFVLYRVVNDRDSVMINITSVFTAPQKATFDSLKRKATEDSIEKSRPAVAPDTTAAGRARRDSIERRRRSDSLAKVEQARIDERRLVALRGGRPLPPKDTTPPPKMKRAPLYTDVFLTPQTALEYETTYILEARPVRSVSGVLKPIKAIRFRTPQKPKPPEPKAEPKRPPGDTAKSVEVPAKR